MTPPEAENNKPQNQTKVVKTFCRICLASCGLEVETHDDVITRIRPDQEHPNNWRDFCSKGGSAHILSYHPQRITKPLKRVGDRYIETTYEEAITDIAKRLDKIKTVHGPHAIATYLGNPGAHNQPGAMAQSAFMKGLKSANSFYVGSVDTNNLQLVSAQMYGSEMAILIPDVDHADCFLFLGMNPAVSKMVWLDIVPDGWNRVLAAKERGADLIVVDPRKTKTAAKATTHVPITVGQDWALLLGIIKEVFQNGWEHTEDCQRAHNIDIIKKLAADASLEDLSIRCGVPTQQIKDIAKRFATATTAVCVARTGLSQNRNGTIGEWLSHVLNLITGRIDRKGGRFFHKGLFKDPLKLLNKLSPPVTRRSRIGGHKAIAGAYPMAIMTDEILTPGQDQVKALIINSGNPVVSGPDGAKLNRALAKLDLLVAIDFFQRESHEHADWIIPGTHFLEREECYLLFSGFYDKPFIQLGQKAVNPPDGVKSEWDFFCDLSLAMKIPFFGIPFVNSIIKASRFISRLTGNPNVAFNVRWLWALIVKTATPLSWKDLVNTPQGIKYGDKTYGHFNSATATHDKKISAAPQAFVSALRMRLSESIPASDNKVLRLISQRDNTMMNSWLVESVKRKVVSGDYASLNSSDASALGIADEQAITISSKTGSLRLKARIDDDLSPGTACIDHGWGSRLFDPVRGAATQVKGVNRNLLIATDGIDELSGIPSLNGTEVTIQPA